MRRCSSLINSNRTNGVGARIYVRIIVSVLVTVVILYVGAMPGKGRQKAETRVASGAAFIRFPRHVVPAVQRLLGSRDTWRQRCGV